MSTAIEQVVDSNGKPLEDGRMYVLSKGSRSMVCKYQDSCFWIQASSERVQATSYCVQRLADWVVQNNQASLVESLVDVQERAKALNDALNMLEAETHELLHAGYTERSRDLVLRFVRDGQLSAEELLAAVKAGS